MSKRPNLFAFQSLSAFLLAFANYKREQSQTWSFGIWARQLGLANVASLTRLVTGDRQPGKTLVQRLGAYFGFDAEEQEYFRYLALLEKKQLDHALRQAVLMKLRHLSTLQMKKHRIAADAAAVLRLRAGHLLSLWGWSPRAVADAFLDSSGLNCVSILGRAAVAVVIADYSETSLEPYREIYIAVLAQPKGHTWHGLYFPFRVQTSALVGGHSMNVGVHGRLGEVTLSDTHATASSSDGFVAELKMGPQPKTEPYEERSELFGLARSSVELCRFAIVLDAKGERRTFDPRYDEVKFGLDLKAMLDALAFEPAYWLHLASLSCDMFETEAVS